MLVKPRSGCLGMLVTWVASAFALWLAARITPGVELGGFKAAMASALVLGLVNALVRPLLVVLTLPITVITLGIFLLVVNGISVGIAAWLVPGFRVDGLLPAIILSVVVTLVSTVIGWILGRDRPASRAA